jgi:hypothetical protein
VAAIIASEDAGEDAAGALRHVAEGGFDIFGTPYEAFIRRYFNS